MAIHLPSEAAPWMERWGRKAFGWTAALALAAGLAGAAWWLYGETQVESTLALVADQTPPAAPAPFAPAPALAPPVAAAPALPPAPESESEPEPEPVSAAPTPAPAPAPALREVKKQRPPPAVRKSVQKKPTVRTVARREPPRSAQSAPPVRPVRAQAAAAPPEDALTETLRLCRAAGYHASLCIKRGCAATKFGLACRG